MESLDAAVLLVMITNVLASTIIGNKFAEKCFPTGNMCDMDVNTCMAEGLRVGLIAECELYQNDVDRVDRPRPFNISIHPLDRSEYPETATYTVCRKTGQLNDWSIPLQSIAGCRDVPLNGSCILPKYQKHDHLFAILPLDTISTNRAWYCIWDVSEIIPLYYDFCDDGSTSRPACIKFTDGLTYYKGPLVPLRNFYPQPEWTDYCFFGAAHDIVTDVAQNGTTILDRDEFFPNKEIGKDCIFVSGGRTSFYDLVRRNTDLSIQDVVCFFVRFPGLSHSWQKKAVCFSARTTRNLIDPTASKLAYTYVAIGVCLVGFSLLVTIVCYGLYKMRAKEGAMKSSIAISTLDIAEADYLDEKVPRGTTSRTDYVEDIYSRGS